MRPEPKAMEKLKALNAKHSAFSDCVEVKETKLQGRFTVAARDIEPGLEVFLKARANFRSCRKRNGSLRLAPKSKSTMASNWALRKKVFEKADEVF